MLSFSFGFILPWIKPTVKGAKEDETSLYVFSTVSSCSFSLSSIKGQTQYTWLPSLQWLWIIDKNSVLLESAINFVLIVYLPGGSS